VLVLERSDATALVGISLREMKKGGRGSGTHVAAWRSTGARQMGSQMSLAAMPAADPTIGCGDRKREPALVPDLVKRLALSDSANQLKKLAGGHAGAGQEMTPEDGKGPATAFALMAVGAKKRNRLTSRWWPWAWYPEEYP